MNVQSLRTDMATSLAELEQRVRDDLACLCLPPANWVVPRPATDGRPVHDVVVIGGGMCGLVASFALRAPASEIFASSTALRLGWRVRG